MIKKMVCSLLTVCASLSAMPKAVVFDFGGVMTSEPKREVVIQFLQDSFSLTSEEFKIANQEKRNAIKLGLTDLEFWLQYANKHHVTLSKDWPNEFNHAMKEAIGVNPQMYALVEELKKKNIPIGMLSNIDERLANLLREYQLYEPFSPCLLSYEIGIEKPDPKAFEILLAELDLKPQDIVFVDDREDNIQTAKSMGFDAILFESKYQIEQEFLKRDLLNE